MFLKLKERFINQKTANKILCILLVAVILPITLIIIAVCTICSNIIVSQTNVLMENKMNMSQKSLENYFTTYENVIMDIYTSNQYASDLERLNLMDMQNYYSIRYRIENNLQDMAYLYPGILGAGLCSQKSVIYYDSLTRQGSFSYCFPKKDKTWTQLVEDTKTYTQTLYKAAQLAGSDNEIYNVIYMAHRIADLNNYARGTIGSIIYCIDEKDIRSAYFQDDDETQMSYLCDQDGRIVSCSREDFIGYDITPDGDVLLQENVMEFAKDAASKFHMLETDKCLVYVRPICDGIFYQVSITDRKALLSDLNFIVRIIVLIGVITILISGIITVYFADDIEKNMNKITRAMDEVLEGNYHVQIENCREDELGKISRQFNDMIKQIDTSMKQENAALLREKNAEIKALEAQINPHFLYNTLDAINWIAIENEQFVISKMLKNLAIILRYSIQKSNSVVTLENEIDYLKKYILLQQQRFDFSFNCFLDIEEGVKCCKVHKLLFQPLVENSIVHGFPGKTGEDTIWIKVEKSDEETLHIIVRDNGVGMDPSLVEELNQFDYRNNKIENSIGIRNVFMRVKYYYGEKGGFLVTSGEDGTEISLKIQFVK